MQEKVENLFLAEEGHQKIALTYVKVLIIIKFSGFFFRKWYKKDTAYRKRSYLCIVKRITEPLKSRGNKKEIRITF